MSRAKSDCDINESGNDRINGHGHLYIPRLLCMGSIEKIGRSWHLPDAKSTILTLTLTLQLFYGGQVSDQTFQRFRHFLRFQK